jgi:hypothetical protein
MNREITIFSINREEKEPIITHDRIKYKSFSSLDKEACDSIYAFEKEMYFKVSDEYERSFITPREGEGYLDEELISFVNSGKCVLDVNVYAILIINMNALDTPPNKKEWKVLRRLLNNGDRTINFIYTVFTRDTQFKHQ